MKKGGSAGKETISGKAVIDARKNILYNIIRLKSKLRDRYASLLEKSSMDHVINILKNLKETEENDIRDIQSVIDSGTVESITSDESENDLTETSMLDHLIMEESRVDHNDVASVLRAALKITNDTISLLSLMIQEYKSEEIRKSLELLLEREKRSKAELELLYEEHVSKDFW